MNAEDPDTDDEIGLTEEEIKEIIGNDNLAIDNLDLPDQSSSLEEESSDVEVGNKQNIGRFIEEIDLSNLDKELATIDLTQENTDKESFEDDLEIDDSHFDLEMEEPSPPFTPPNSPDIPLAPARKSPPVKKKSKPPSAGSPTPMKTKKNTKPIQKAASKTTSPAKKSSRPSRPSSPKTAPKTNQKPIRAKSKKPTPTQTGSGYNTQQMKALFLLLDEMLSHLPQEKIKKFAFTPEYEYYLTLLKKLGI